jgi:hypothetical protein
MRKDGYNFLLIVAVFVAISSFSPPWSRIIDSLLRNSPSCLHRSSYSPFMSCVAWQMSKGFVQIQHGISKASTEYAVYKPSVSFAFTSPKCIQNPVKSETPIETMLCYFISVNLQARDPKNSLGALTSLVVYIGFPGDG